MGVTLSQKWKQQNPKELERQLGSSGGTAQCCCIFLATEMTPATEKHYDTVNIGWDPCSPILLLQYLWRIFLTTAQNSVLLLVYSQIQRISLVTTVATSVRPSVLLQLHSQQPVLPPDLPSKQNSQRWHIQISRLAGLKRLWSFQYMTKKLLHTIFQIPFVHSMEDRNKANTVRKLQQCHTTYIQYFVGPKQAAYLT